MRLAHVRAEDDLCAVLHEVADGGERADDAVFVRDLAVLHGDVEVAAHEHALAFPVFYVFYRHFVHGKILLIFHFIFFHMINLFA